MVAPSSVGRKMGGCRSCETANLWNSGDLFPFTQIVILLTVGRVTDYRLLLEQLEDVESLKQ